MHLCTFLVRVLLGCALTSDGLYVQPSSQDSRARSRERDYGYGDTWLRTAEGCPSPSIPYNATTCVTDVMDYEYWLPPPDVYNYYTVAHEDWSQDQNDVWERIKKLQEPATCNNQEWHLIKFTSHGFAYNLWNFVFLAARYWDNHSPVLVGNSKYRLTDTKCGRGYLCTLSPLTRCRIENIDPALVKVTGDNRGVLDLGTMCSPGGKYDVELGGCKCAKGYYPWAQGCSQSPDDDRDRWQEQYNDDPIKFMSSRTYYDTTPGEFNWRSNPQSPADDVPEDSWAEKRSLTWWHAQHLWYLYKDSPEAKELHEWLETKHMSPTCVAVHVRHNDACSDVSNTWKRCFKFEDYSTQLDIMDGLYGPFEHVYLATDDHAVIEDAQQSRWSSRLIRQEYDRAQYRGNVDNEEKFEGDPATRTIKRDIFAMSKCKAFIGTMSSSVAWVTYELMMARHGHYVPFISLHGAFNDEIIGGRTFRHP